MLKKNKFFLGLIGIGLFLATYQVTVGVLRLPRFRKLPSLIEVFVEWVTTQPDFNISIFTKIYYLHIFISCGRVLVAFVVSSMLGIIIGLLMGWSKTFKDYTFPILEIIRPIPVLAWVPLANLMFPTEFGIIFVVSLAAFYATILNTILGVELIDRSYIRAALCLGANKWQVFKDVIIPGSLPYIFIGLRIGMGLSWVCLVAGEMLSGNYGIGYMILATYSLVQYKSIVIGMFTLGILGSFSFYLMSLLGNYLMAWKVREIRS